MKIFFEINNFSINFQKPSSRFFNFSKNQLQNLKMYELLGEFIYNYQYFKNLQIQHGNFKLFMVYLK